MLHFFAAGDRACLGSAGGRVRVILDARFAKEAWVAAEKRVQDGLDALGQILLSVCAGRLVLGDVIPRLSGSSLFLTA